MHFSMFCSAASSLGTRRGSTVARDQNLSCREVERDEWKQINSTDHDNADDDDDDVQGVYFLSLYLPNDNDHDDDDDVIQGV